MRHELVYCNDEALVLGLSNFDGTRELVQPWESQQAEELIVVEASKNIFKWDNRQ